MSNDMKQFENQLRNQHSKLTDAFNQSQKAFLKAKQEHDQHKVALQEFRAEYGPVIEALDKAASRGALQVESE